jgi:glucose/arabinose dehydrogenase
MGRRQGLIGVVLAVLALALALPSTASALRLRRVATGFDNLTQVTAPRRGDRAGVLYLVEQEGQIFRRLNGRNRLFLDIRNSVLDGGERGLLSLAFDPGYETNRFVYVYYTNNDGNIRVARFRANSNSTRVVSGSGKVFLRVPHPVNDNHNGGQLAFGPNGRLYAGTGDGGGGCDPGENAQDLSSRLGKLLSSNPRNLRAGWRIDGYGLRNPWRFSFDRATGRLYIGDVGQDSIEEVDTRRASALGGTRENYGWDVFEGTAASGCATGGLNGSGRLVRPISQYGHAGGRCSITGGFAYRGRALRWLRGSYVFADFCTGEIWRIKVNSAGRRTLGRRLLKDTQLNITSFGEGVRGEVYVVEQSGSVFRLVRS